MEFDELWLDVNIATMHGKKPYGQIQNGALGIKDEKIAWIGKQKTLQREKFFAKKIHRCKNWWVTPGLIDCHTHLIFGGNRVNEFELRQKGVSYEEISKLGGGIKSTVKSSRQASFQELYKSAKHRLDTLLEDGVTTVEIKSGYGLDKDTEIKLLEVACLLEQKSYATIHKTFLGAHAVPLEYSGRQDEYIDFICNEVLPEIRKRNLADSVDAFCENIAFNTTQIDRLFKDAQKLGFPLRLHAEQLSDQKGAVLAAKYKALSVDHLEYIGGDGIKAIAKSKTVAVLLPGASYFLSEEQRPPFLKLREEGVPIAIATDLNPGTSPVNSLLAVMNMACVLWKFTPEEALRAVTENAAKALGLGSKIGSLRVGKNADFVVWDIETPAQLSYGIGLRPEKIIVKNGKVVK